MALPKVKEARELDDEALAEAIVETKRRLFDLRFKKATRQEQSGFHRFKHERHRLAQLMTVVRERQLAQASLNEAEVAPAAAVGTSEEE